MIVFLMLAYVAVLFALVKAKVIRWNLWWKVSPVVWTAFLFIALFIPMQWGAPSGPVNTYQFVVEIVPNVSGEVVEVPVRPFVPLKAGDVLFRIDPEPYQLEVDRLTSLLEQTKSDVEQLGEAAKVAAATLTRTTQQIEIQKGAQAEAVSDVAAAQAMLGESKAGIESAEAQVAALTVAAEVADRELARQRKLFESKASTQDDVDKALQQAEIQRGQRKVAQAGLQKAQETLSRSAAGLEKSRIAERQSGLVLKQLVEADVPLAEAQQRQAELAANSKIGDVHTRVASVQAQLARAQYELNECVVRAPAEGYVVAVTLRPGQRVANVPMRSWMAFVVSEQGRVVVGINQSVVRHVKPGDSAEVVFKLYPGLTYSAKVESVAEVTQQGQIQASGQLATGPTLAQGQLPYAVVLKIDDPRLDATEIPGGAIGSAAIYTESVRPTHVVRRVMLRMEAWLNYVKP